MATIAPRRRRIAEGRFLLRRQTTRKRMRAKLADIEQDLRPGLRSEVNTRRHGSLLPVGRRVRFRIISVKPEFGAALSRVMGLPAARSPIILAKVAR